MSLTADLASALLDAERARGRRLSFELPQQRVSAHEGEMRAKQMRRSIDRMRARVREGGAAACAECPAAQLLGTSGANGVTVKCGVEKSLVTERESPSSLVNFCLAPAGMNEGYAACPSWRAEKEREWHGNRAPLIAAHEGV